MGYKITFHDLAVNQADPFLLLRTRWDGPEMSSSLARPGCHQDLRHRLLKRRIHGVILGVFSFFRSTKALLVDQHGPWG